jgi:Flp pilus assembly protein TadD
MTVLDPYYWLLAHEQAPALAMAAINTLTDGQQARLLALLAWQNDQDQQAVQHLARASQHGPPDSLLWASSLRLYGLALIRVQREVEGTFALERADGWLELHGFLPFSWAEVAEALSLAA